MSQRPNVLFILSDQHNAKVLGHQGHPNVKTPHLDRLAAAGVRFDTAITQNPICTPSRVSFLSGQYCHNHGYYGLSGPNPGGLPSLFDHFRAAGYRTSAIGKIHCPEYWVEDGADTFHETCDCSAAGRSTAYRRFLQERGKADLEDHIALNEFGPRGLQSMEGRPSAVTYEESQEGWIAAQTIACMAQATRGGQPFFAFASLPRPHQCTAPSAPFWEMYEGVDLALPPNADADPKGRAPHFRQTVAHWRAGKWTLFEPHGFEAGRRRKLRGYLGAVSQVDHAVGQMVDALDHLGVADHTIVIYSSDHGDYATEHGIMEKAPGICSDAITRIPFIWRWPGQFRAGHVARELVESVDVSATLCALTGLPALETSDGKDLTPLLHGGTGELRRIAVTEFPWSRSVRRGQYRLVCYARELFAAEHSDGFGELYDLAADPWELRNLYFEASHREVVRELERELLDWLLQTTRPVTAHPVSAPLGPQTVQRYKCTVHRDGKLSPAYLAQSRSKHYL